MTYLIKVYLIKVGRDFVLSEFKPPVSSYLDASFYSKEVALQCKEMLESASPQEHEQIIEFFVGVVDEAKALTYI